MCVFGLIPCSSLRSALANLDRGFENRPDGEYSSQFVGCYGGQAHGCDASAGCAIRIPAKLAWSDLCPQVSRQRLGRECENTILGAVWGRGELPNHPLRHVQFRILPSQFHKFRDGPRPLLCAQNLRHSIPNLRSEQAKPYLLDLRAWRPEFQELRQVSRSLHHLTRDRAMDRDFLSHDVSKNALVHR